MLASGQHPRPLESADQTQNSVAIKASEVLKVGYYQVLDRPGPVHQTPEKETALVKAKVSAVLCIFEDVIIAPI